MFSFKVSLFIQSWKQRGLINLVCLVGKDIYLLVEMFFLELHNAALNRTKWRTSCPQTLLFSYHRLDGQTESTVFHLYWPMPGDHWNCVNAWINGRSSGRLACVLHIIDPSWLLKPFSKSTQTHIREAILSFYPIVFSLSLFFSFSQIQENINSTPHHYPLKICYAPPYLLLSAGFQEGQSRYHSRTCPNKQGEAPWSPRKTEKWQLDSTAVSLQLTVWLRWEGQNIREES